MDNPLGITLYLPNPLRHYLFDSEHGKLWRVARNQTQNDTKLHKQNAGIANEDFTTLGNQGRNNAKTPQKHTLCDRNTRSRMTKQTKLLVPQSHAYLRCKTQMHQQNRGQRCAARHKTQRNTICMLHITMPKHNRANMCRTPKHDCVIQTNMCRTEQKQYHVPSRNNTMSIKKTSTYHAPNRNQPFLSTLHDSQTRMPIAM